MALTLREQFTSRQHTPVVQFIKYAIAGGIATAVHITLFNLGAAWLFPALNPSDPVVRYLHLHATDVGDALRARNVVLDNVIAFMFSNLTAYLLNVTWVFHGGRHNRWVEIAFFYAVSGISMAVGSGLAWVLIAWFGITTTFAFGANILASLLINFVLRKFVIFKG